MDPPKRLTSEEIAALSVDEKKRKVAEWQSYHQRRKMEAMRHDRAENLSARGYGRGRGGPAAYRGRGRGRGRGGFFVNQSAYFNGDGVVSAGLEDATVGPADAADNGTMQVATHGVPTRASQQQHGSRYPEFGFGFWAPQVHKLTASSVAKHTEKCRYFTTTGICTRPSCPFVHDPKKTAICKSFLKGKCTFGDACNLSHEPTANRMPQCTYFLRGFCSNDDCIYAHINVNPAAPLCDSFGKLGYCEKGNTCLERHAFECPDFSNTGKCDNKNCRLTHVRQAGRLRQAAKSSSPISEPQTAMGPSDTVDTEADITMNVDEEKESGDGTAPLTQQLDYIPI